MVAMAPQSDWATPSTSLSSSCQLCTQLMSRAGARSPEEKQDRLGKLAANAARGQHNLLESCGLMRYSGFRKVSHETSFLLSIPTSE